MQWVASCSLAVALRMGKESVGQAEGDSARDSSRSTTVFLLPGDLAATSEDIRNRLGQPSALTWIQGAGAEVVGKSTV